MPIRQALTTKFIIANYDTLLPIVVPLLRGVVKVDSVLRDYVIDRQIITNKAKPDDSTTVAPSQDDSEELRTSTVWNVEINLSFDIRINDISGVLDVLLSLVDKGRFDVNRLRFTIIMSNLFMTNLYLISASHNAGSINQTLKMVFSSSIGDFAKDTKNVDITQIIKRTVNLI